MTDMGQVALYVGLCPSIVRYHVRGILLTEITYLSAHLAEAVLLSTIFSVRLSDLTRNPERLFTSALLK